MDMKLVGGTIGVLRKEKGLTQNELGQRLGVSFQAVSKWERGETLPDTAILPDLAEILETTVDYLLTGGKRVLSFRGKITVAQMAEGILSLKRMGELLGRDNLFYRYAVEGINAGMNTDIEAAFGDENIMECFVAEAVLQSLAAGKYVDLTDARNSFRQERFRDMVLRRCESLGIR